MSKVYEIITSKIIEKLEAGVVPWHKPWGTAGEPKNLVSKKEYRGINTFLLGCAGYSSAYWATFNQIKEKGGKLKKGAKSEMIVFWKPSEQKAGQKDGAEITEEGVSKRFILRYYRVFNLSDVEGIETDEDKEENKIEFVPLEKAEEITEGYKTKPPVKHEMQRACYFPSKDFINMPKKESFEAVEEYYSTLFHELAHSTGHKSRLNREGIEEQAAAFGSKTYSKEELIAEITAAFLCAEAKIDGVFDNSAAYIAGWVKKFKDQPKMIVLAAAAAQRAADYMLNKTPGTE
jgi:antirestriction protein ArdC